MTHLSFHLSELLWRFFYLLIFSLFSFFILSYYFKEVTFYFICLKADLSYIILTHPFDGFLSFLSFSSFISIFIIFLPLLIIHSYLYIRPIRRLSGRKRNLVGEIIGIIILAFIPIFSLYLALKLLPYAIKILISPIFGQNTLHIYWIPQIKGIINLLMALTITVLFYLFLPLIFLSFQFLFGNPNSLFLYKEMGKWRPVAIVIILTGISIITPPDLVTLLITGLPLIILLELTYFISLIVFKYFTTLVDHPPMEP